MTTCAVTIYPSIPTRGNGSRGVRTYSVRACGEPVVSDGLCAVHLAEKERLS